MAWPLRMKGDMEEGVGGFIDGAALGGAWSEIGGIGVGGVEDDGVLRADDVGEDIEDRGALGFIGAEEAGGEIDVGAELELALVILGAGADEPDGAALGVGGAGDALEEFGEELLAGDLGLAKGGDLLDEALDAGARGFDGSCFCCHY